MATGWVPDALKDDDEDAAVLRVLLRTASSPTQREGAAQLAALAEAHAFADIDVTPADVELIWSLVEAAVSCPAAADPAWLRCTWMTIIAALSDVATPAVVPTLEVRATRPFFDGLLSRLGLSSVEVAAAQERASETYAGVALSTVTPDAEQPKTGSISQLHRDPATSSVPPPAVSVAAVKRPVVKQRRGMLATPWDEGRCLRALLYWTLAVCPAARAAAAGAMVAFLSVAVVADGGSPASAMAARSVLQVVLALLRGIPAPLTTVTGDAEGGCSMPPPPVRTGKGAPHMSAFDWLGALLPLHGVAGAMGTSSCTLQLFHEPLTKCLHQLLRIEPSCLVAIASELVAQWTAVEKGNSPKGVLLLHELDQILRYPGIGPRDLRAAVVTCAPLLCSALSSDNSRLAQQALAIVHVDAVLAALVGGEDAGARERTAAVLAALWRGGSPHWNGTVNKQTRAVIEALLALAPPALDAAIAAVVGTSSDAPPLRLVQAEQMQLAGSRGPIPLPRSMEPNLELAASAPSVAQSTLPPAASTGAKRANPPLTITGVAPWAVPVGGRAVGTGASGAPVRAHPPLTVTGIAPWAAAQQNAPRNHLPPVTITGIAPWATAPLRSHPPQHDRMQLISASGAPPDSSVALPPVSATPALARATWSSTSTPVSRLLSFLDELAPAQASEPSSSQQPGLRRSSQPASAVAADIIAATEIAEDPSLPAALSSLPTLLPSLRFHDLVFGYDDLGAGAFSVVRYAKRIIHDAPRATWPEYAVKVVSTSTMRRLGYEARVRREIAVLSVLTHPSIARLVSAFRWRDGAYLVLEYASQGDLHSLLSKLGSLAEEPARFLMAEVVAALVHVHEKGFVYGDLKPENCVLLPGLGGGSHLKLADMGACLPYSPTARALVAGNRHILENLRDGDWRSRTGVGIAPSNASVSFDDAGAAAADSCSDTAEWDGGDEGDEEDEEDWRIEGTSEYLSPEVRSGDSMPTVSSDAYALGVTIFQVLAGRMPEPERIWGSSSGSSAAGHVHFSSESGAGSSRSGAGGFPRGFPSVAADLVTGLLHPDPQQRLGGSDRGFEEVFEHPWFAPVLALAAPFPVSGASGSGAASAATSPKPPVATLRTALLSLHRQASPAAVGGIASADEAAGTWSRRHYSSMFAPMPRAYTTFLAAGSAMMPGGNSTSGKRSGSSCDGSTGDGDFDEATDSGRQQVVSLRSYLGLDVLPPLSPSIGN